MQFIRVLMISLLALAMNTVVWANVNEEINCPSIDTIHQYASLIQDASFSQINHAYVASTGQSVFKDNNVYWDLQSRGIIANNVAEAIEIAQKRAATVSQMLFETAKEQPELGG